MHTFNLHSNILLRYHNFILFSIIYQTIRATKKTAYRIIFRQAVLLRPLIDSVEAGAVQSSAAHAHGVYGK